MMHSYRHGEQCFSWGGCNHTTVWIRYTSCEITISNPFVIKLVDEFPFIRESRQLTLP